MSDIQEKVDIQEKIDQERQEARAACDVNGADSPACAAAWDVVEIPADMQEKA